jgi:hypothetical protein
MEAIETEAIEQDGQTYRISIFHDPDAGNPLEDWSEMGTILSLNRRHGNFDAAGVEDAIHNNPDAVALAYNEHGLCLWTVAGELPAHLHCPWDSVAFAGVWLPDAGTLALAKNYGGWTRQLFMRRRARQACEAYTQWSNGDVYGYEVERVTTCEHCGQEGAEPVDSCWGFYGLDYCRDEARAIAEARARRADGA